MTLAPRASAVRCMLTAVPCVVALAACVPLVARGGSLDPFGLEGTGAAGRSGMQNPTFLAAGSVAPGRTSAAVGLLTSVATAPRDSVDQATVDTSTTGVEDWQARFKAAGYAKQPAFNEERDEVGAAEVASVTEGGSGSARWNSDTPNRHGGDDGTHPYAMPDWSKQVRLGLRTAAFAFYLSPSIPETIRAAY